MPLNSLTITIIFIILSTLIAAFVRGRKKDKCLVDFRNDTVTLEQVNGKMVCGKLTVENTGMELLYKEKQKDAAGHDEASYLLYKHEFGNIQAILRFHDDLDQKNRKDREKELKKIYHPGFFRRLNRKTLNIFRTIRDSVAEVINVLISQAKKVGPAGGVLTSQDKHVTQIKQELMGSVATSYEPLLEKYIGHKVVLEIIKGDKIVEYPGVLKDYTADFIAILDANYQIKDGEPMRKADIVVPRKIGIVRHVGE